MIVRLRQEAVAVVILTATMIAVILLNDATSMLPLRVIRFFLTLVWLFVIPGYFVVCGLFPRDDTMDFLERLGISIGISIAIIPPLALFIDVAPFAEIRLGPIIIVEVLVMLVTGSLAYYRRAALPPEEQFLLRSNWPAGLWWKSQPLRIKLIYISVLMSAGIVAVAGALILSTPSPSALRTDFYLLNEEGQTENYPFQLTQGDLAHLIIGISNLENSQARYSVRVTSGINELFSSEFIDLAHGESTQIPITIEVTEPGDDVLIDFLLYKEPSEDIYRRLRLLIDVQDPGT